MTVPVQFSRRVVANGGASVTTLTHQFLLEDAAYLSVYADGFQLTQGVDYTVSGLGDVDGYTVTISNPLDWTPETWVLNVVMPVNQPSDVDLGGQFGLRFEEALDRMARLIQTLDDRTKRSAKVSLETPLATEVTFASPVPDSLIGWNQTGTALENKGTIPSITVVVDNIAAINNVSNNIGAVNSVDANMASVASVHANIGAVTTVSGNIGAVNNVSANMTGVLDVAGNVTELMVVYANLPGILAAEQHAEDAEDARDLAQVYRDQAEGFRDGAQAAENNVSLAAVPIGAVCWFLTEKDRPGYIRADGRPFDPLVYPELALEFPSGNVPDIANRVMRMVGDDTPAVGEHQEDAMQRITGTGTGWWLGGGAVATGVFELTSRSGAGGTGSGATIADVVFDSGNSPGARVSDDETRVKTIIGVAYIKAYGALIDQGTADLVAIETAQQYMLRFDAQALAPAQQQQVAQNLGLPISRMWESAPQSITVAGALTLAHDLAVRPTLLVGVFRCETAEFGYAAGDEIFDWATGFNAAARGVAFAADASSVSVKYGSNATPMYFMALDTGNTVSMTLANWRFIVRAYA